LSRGGVAGGDSRPQLRIHQHTAIECVPARWLTGLIAVNIIILA